MKASGRNEAMHAVAGRLASHGLMLLCVMCAGLWFVSAAAAEPPPFVEKAATPELLASLRAGGFVLYMRHGNTDNKRPDRVPHVDLDDCSTQRPLTEEGRQVAAQVGAAIRNARIPIGEVVVSPMCRTRESARAAFGDSFTVDKGLMYSSNLSSEEKLVMLATTRALLAAPVAAGKNRVVVAHAPNLMDVMGYFVKPEATVVIIRPQGESGFEYLGSIQPAHWQALLK